MQLLTAQMRNLILAEVCFFGLILFLKLVNCTVLNLVQFSKNDEFYFFYAVA